MLHARGGIFVLGDARRLPLLCIASVGERMRLHTSRGRSDACAVVERSLDAYLANLGDHAWGPRAPAAEHLRRGRDAVQTYLLRALATLRYGDDGAGLLDEALSLSRKRGLTRIVADTHPDLVRTADPAPGAKDGGPGPRA